MPFISISPLFSTSKESMWSSSDCDSELGSAAATIPIPPTPAALAATAAKASAMVPAAISTQPPHTHTHPPTHRGGRRSPGLGERRGVALRGEAAAPLGGSPPSAGLCHRAVMSRRGCRGAAVSRPTGADGSAGSAICSRHSDGSFRSGKFLLLRSSLRTSGCAAPCYGNSYAAAGHGWSVLSCG